MQSTVHSIGLCGWDLAACKYGNRVISCTCQNYVLSSESCIYNIGTVFFFRLQHKKNRGTLIADSLQHAQGFSLMYNGRITNTYKIVPLMPNLARYKRPHRAGWPRSCINSHPGCVWLDGVGLQENVNYAWSGYISVWRLWAAKSNEGPDWCNLWWAVCLSLLLVLTTSIIQRAVIQVSVGLLCSACQGYVLIVDDPSLCCWQATSYQIRRYGHNGIVSSHAQKTLHLEAAMSTALDHIEKVRGHRGCLLV